MVDAYFAPLGPQELELASRAEMQAFAHLRQPARLLSLTHCFKLELEPFA